MAALNQRHCTPIGKFQRLLDYLDNVQLDSALIAAEAGLDADSINTSKPQETLPTYQYSNLYSTAAQHMQNLDIALPWGAGIGTDVFRFMCYSIISCQTLGEALQRAEQYQRLLYPQTGYRISLNIQDNTVQLGYDINTEQTRNAFAPDSWDRTPHMEIVAKSSSLKIWYAFIGWLIGRNIDLLRVSVSAPGSPPQYVASLKEVFQSEIEFDADASSLFFPSSYLDFKLVHTEQSLQAFLDNAIYSLITQDQRPASTGAAIKSLLAKNGPGTPPSFETMAHDLHMSASSLRRRLQKEGVSYQDLKDLYRCEIAMEKLREGVLRIQDIGELLGFMEPSSFIRSFRSWTGLTPKQYRREALTISR